jgi:leucyl-tRNA synthetase
MWKSLGKEGFAVQAPWPIAGEEDKLLTRQAKYLGDSLKRFRGQAGKAKKEWKAATILVSDSYPQWKVDTLKWMQEQCNAESGFPDSFMKDLKGWIAETVSDKKLMKFIMQFASFMKNEAREVGVVALDIHMPFDQAAIFEGSMQYIKSQLNIKELEILKLDGAAAEVPDRIAEQVAPGKPFLWMR